MSTARRVTLRDIATAAGVSAPTVSNVLSGKDGHGKVRVSEATKARVLQAADELGYTPSLMGQSIRLGRTNQVCVVPQQLHSPWTEALVDAISASCRTDGKRPLILADGDWQTFLAGQGADGAVLADIGLGSDGPRRLRRLADSGTAIVLFDDADIDPDGFDVIRRPILPAIRQAVRELTTRHRRIALLAEDHDNTTDIRLAAFCSVLRSARSRVDPDLIGSTNADRYQAFRQAMTILQLRDRPTAIMATQDLSAISALWAAQRLGITVPDELEIIGVGNTPEALQTDPALSSVGPAPYFDEVAQLLMARLRGEGPTERCHLYPGRVWHRGTTIAAG